MKHKLISMLLAVTLGTSICGIVANADDDPYKVGFVLLESTGTSYNQLLSMQEKCAERGWELVYDSADNSSEKTVTLVQNFITQECDAIYVYTCLLYTSDVYKRQVCCTLPA